MIGIGTHPEPCCKKHGGEGECPGGKKCPAFRFFNRPVGRLILGIYGLRMKQEDELSDREWTEDMGQISGSGGAYERACRVMVLAGLDWLGEHPDAEPKFHGYENVTGILVPDDDDAKAMIDHMIAAAKAYGKEYEDDDDGVTGAMVQFTVGHARMAHTKGWEAYQKMMRELPADPDDAPATDG